jgi:hypothetical protein
MSVITISEDGAKWLGGLLDGFGEIGWNAGAPVVKFKTAFADRLEAIEAVLTEKGPRSRPFAISGDSQMPQRILIFRGTDFIMLENAVTKYMKTSKKLRFGKQRARWVASLKERALKKQRRDQ